jgi:hypothetical protein
MRPFTGATIFGTRDGRMCRTAQLLRGVQKVGALQRAVASFRQYQVWCDDGSEKPETQTMFGMRLRERGFVSNKIKRGPHKDRKGWFGIGLRADHLDPEDPESSNDGPSDGARTGDEGPRGGPSTADDLLEESRSSKPNSSGTGVPSGQSGPQGQNPTYQYPRVKKDSEKGSAMSAPPGWAADPMRFYGSGDAGAEASE